MSYGSATDRQREDGGGHEGMGIKVCAGVGRYSRIVCGQGRESELRESGRCSVQGGGRAGEEGVVIMQSQGWGMRLGWGAGNARAACGTMVSVVVILAVNRKWADRPV